MLAQALISLLTNKPLRQKMAARARLKAMEYSWEHIAQKVSIYYTSILSESPRKNHLPKVEAMPV
jgi:glycosyltransferase involved in cell wall biosynthesis